MAYATSSFPLPLLAKLVEPIWTAISGWSDLNLDSRDATGQDNYFQTGPRQICQDIDVSEFLAILAFNYSVFSPFKNILR